jgi:hypothetical protein
MKRFIGIVLSTGLTMGVAGVALAQGGKAPAPAAKGDENVSYKAKTVYDFETDVVEGELQSPDGELLTSVGKQKQSSLIEIRKDFIPEMLKSLEDI